MRATKKDIENKINYLNTSLNLKINLDYNPNSSSKFVITFDGKNRENSDNKLYFEKASECFLFLDSLYKLKSWDIIKVK